MKKTQLEDHHRVVKFLRVPYHDSLLWRNREEYRVVYVSSWEVTHLDVSFGTDNSKLTTIHLADKQDIDVAEPIDVVAEKLFGNYSTATMKKRGNTKHA